MAIPGKHVSHQGQNAAVGIEMPSKQLQHSYDKTQSNDKTAVLRIPNEYM